MASSPQTASSTQPPKRFFKLRKHAPDKVEQLLGRKSGSNRNASRTKPKRMAPAETTNYDKVVAVPRHQNAEKLSTESSLLRNRFETALRGSTAQLTDQLSKVTADSNVRNAAIGAAAIGAVALAQKFCGKNIARPLRSVDFALMTLSARSAMRLVDQARSEATEHPSSAMTIRPVSETTAMIAAAHGIGFALVPNVARWMSAGFGAVAASGMLDDAMRIAFLRAARLNGDAPRGSASPVKRYLNA